MAISAKSLTPKVKMPSSKTSKAPSIGNNKTPNVGNGLKGYLAASKMVTGPKPPKNGLDMSNL